MRNYVKAMIIGAAILMAAPNCAAAAPQKTSKARCVATTQKGERCKNDVVNNGKFCRVHLSSQNPTQCKATTQAGKQCARAAKKNGYCQQHYKAKKK